MKYQSIEPVIGEKGMCSTLSAFRQFWSLNKTQMAKLLNIPYNTYVLWEKGATRIRHKTILLLALEGLRVDLTAKDDLEKLRDDLDEEHNRIVSMLGEE